MSNLYLNLTDLKKGIKKIKNELIAEFIEMVKELREREIKAFGSYYDGIDAIIENLEVKLNE